MPRNCRRAMLRSLFKRAVTAACRGRDEVMRLEIVGGAKDAGDLELLSQRALNGTQLCLELPTPFMRLAEALGSG